MEHKYQKTIITTLVLSGLYGNSLAEVIMDGSMGTSGEIQVTDNTYEITSDLGRINGSNLFHSFSDFNVEQNHTAHFSDPSNSNISNIITRVTGSNPSEIHGIIRSSIPNADFYLLNPNGILFGESASLDITGSFHATTANYIDFSDGFRMDTTVSPNIAFTSAAPSEFGFTSLTPGKINANGGNLSVSNGNAISLIGGDINIDGTTLLSNDGIVNIASVASQGEVVKTGEDVHLVGFAELGDMELTNNTAVDVSGDNGGRVVIRGGTLTMKNSTISNDSGGFIAGGTSEGIDIETGNSINITENSIIHSNASSIASAKEIRIKTASLSLLDHSLIMSNTDLFSFGSSGKIVIDAESFNVTNGSQIQSLNYGNGNASTITINSKSIDVTGPALSDDPFGNDFTGFQTYKTAEFSEKGDININSETLRLENRAAIQTTNDGSFFDAAIIGSDISINARQIDILNGSHVATVAKSNGNGGNIYVNSEVLNIAGAHPDPYTFFDSLGTHITTIERSYISTKSEATVFSGFFTSGKSGDIAITTEELNVLDGATIQSFTFNSTSKNGDVTIDSAKTTISGTNEDIKDYFLSRGQNHESATINSSSRIETITIFEDFGFPFEPGLQGFVNITSDSLQLRNNGHISSFVRGSGNGSKIDIEANEFNINTGSYLTTSNVGYGDAGDIVISAESISLDGSNSPFVKTGLYTSTSEFGGNGGNISIKASDIDIKNQALISSETNGDGDGGDISISALNTLKLNNSVVSASGADGTSGNAGNLALSATTLVLNNSKILTEAYSGQGGDILINAKNLISTANTEISAMSELSISGEVITNVEVDITDKTMRLPDNISQPVFFNNQCNGPMRDTSSFSTPKSLAANQSGYMFLPSIFNNSNDNLLETEYNEEYNPTIVLSTVSVPCN